MLDRKIRLSCHCNFRLFARNDFRRQAGRQAGRQGAITAIAGGGGGGGDGNASVMQCARSQVASAYVRARAPPFVEIRVGAVLGKFDFSLFVYLTDDEPRTNRELNIYNIVAIVR